MRHLAEILDEEADGLSSLDRDVIRNKTHRVVHAHFDGARNVSRFPGYADRTRLLVTMHCTVHSGHGMAALVISGGHRRGGCKAQEKEEGWFFHDHWSLG